jgi:hypothetical protein
MGTTNAEIQASVLFPENLKWFRIRNYFTVKYKTAGQNIAYMSSYKKYPDTDTSIQRFIMKMWFEDEHKAATKSDIEKFPCPASNK